MTEQIGKVVIQINKNLNGHNFETGVTATLRLEESNFKNLSPKETRQEVILPIGDMNEKKEFELTVGHWSIDVDLPWGDNEQQDFEVFPDKTQIVTINTEESPRESLRWYHYLGAVQGPKRHQNTQEWSRIQKRAGIENDTIREKIIETINTEHAHDLTSLRNSISSQDKMMRSLPYDEIANVIYGMGTAESPSNLITCTLFEDRDNSNLNWDSLQVIDGSIESFSSINLYQHSSLREKPKDIYTIFSIPQYGDREFRKWALVDGFGQRRLLSLPIPWENAGGQGGIPLLEILIRFIEDKRGLAELLIKDDSVMSMLGYMTSDRMQHAAKLADKARGWLFYKVTNPFAAPAGGYIMLATQLNSSDTKWRQWILNLSVDLEFIPDGAILEGAMRLNGPSDIRDFERAAECFVNAYHRGLPFYTLGLSWLLSGMSMLESDFPELSQYVKPVRYAARIAETNKPFTTLRLPDKSEIEEE